MLRGFAISLTNPKTLLFYGAFFPQFLTPNAPIAPQVALLSLTFLLSPPDWTRAGRCWRVACAVCWPCAASCATGCLVDC